MSFFWKNNFLKDCAGNIEGAALVLDPKKYKSFCRDRLFPPRAVPAQAPESAIQPRRIVLPLPFCFIVFIHAVTRYSCPGKNQYGLVVQWCVR